MFIYMEWDLIDLSFTAYESLQNKSRIVKEATGFQTEANCRTAAFSLDSAVLQYQLRLVKDRLADKLGVSMLS